MRSSPVLNVLLALALAASSSTAEIADQNTISQERGTVAPAQTTDTTSLHAQVSSTTEEREESATYTDTSGSDEIAYVSVWGAPVVAKTSSNHSAAEATFGKITSKSGECVVAEPTEYISKKYLDWVWQHRIGPTSDTSSTANWNILDNKNWIMDHLVHNNGSMNYCVRWDSSTSLSKDVASKFQGILRRHYNAWNKWLEGYNCWPFTELDINMVGWATKDKAQFEWTDESMGPIYEGVLDPTNGVAQCPDECYRFYDNANNQWSDTSNCKGEPYDVSLWLKEDIPYGFGYDWGQEISLNNTLQNLHDKNLLFFAHEIGHGLGLPDFYGLQDKPATDFPNCVMMAYSSITVTPGDGWMLRRVLDNVRDRYNF